MFDLNKHKIKVYENSYLKLENFKNIILISDTLIKIDNYIIIGNNLKIKKIEDSLIEIIGIVSNIEYIVE